MGSADPLPLVEPPLPACLPSDCANVAMKINHKLDGCNVRLTDNMAQLAPPIGARPFMIFG